MPLPTVEVPLRTGGMIMDAAIALAQTYLRLNGYFPETEYPMVTFDGKNAITLSDIDIPAIRFPRAGRWIPGPRGMLPPDLVVRAVRDNRKASAGIHKYLSSSKRV